MEEIVYLKIVDNGIESYYSFENIREVSGRKRQYIIEDYLEDMVRDYNITYQWIGNYDNTLSYTVLKNYLCEKILELS